MDRKKKMVLNESGKKIQKKIVKNANFKMRMLQIASKFMKNKEDLLHIYKAFIRSKLEF